MTSTYAWKGAVERGRERQVVVKTVRARLPLLASRLATLHPYEVPELIALAADGGGEAYLAWVRESTAG
jgi:periplasmic divalent cation tolerance protein